MPDDRIVISLRLPRSLGEQVKGFASKHRLPVNTVITDAIRLAINPSAGPHRNPENGSFENNNHTRRLLPPKERDCIASWVSLTQPVLGCFRLHLEGVDEDPYDDANASFVGSRMEKRFILSAAITALGTWLYGGRGRGREDKNSVNMLKKKADAISAYILSEALYYSTRGLRENHALMVSLGEGAMPKSGETPEEGANPQIAFGRVFARPDVASVLRAELRLLLDPARTSSGWETFWGALQRERLTVWGAVIDTLENTSRFTLGESTGPMVVLHIFDQPLIFTSPYESYMGALTVPAEVVDMAVHRSLAIHYLTPRATLLDAIRATYPQIRPENIHVWALGGPKRADRLGQLWKEWEDLGVHLIENGWKHPITGMSCFTDSGTYAPVYQVGGFESDGKPHLFLTDGYASTAEAIQAASLDSARKQRTFLCPFAPKFDSVERSYQIMRLKPQSKPSGDFVELQRDLSKILGYRIDEADAQQYNKMLLAADRANMPRGRDILTIDDFLPNKNWQCLAIRAAILDDPYSGMPGIREVGENAFRVCVGVVDASGRDQKVTLTLGLQDAFAEDRAGAIQKAEDSFSPLIDRLCKENAYESRPIKSSDVGRILNELRTWSWNSVFDLVENERVKTCVNLDSVDEVVISTEKRRSILRILKNYIRDYPTLAGHVILRGRLAEEV